MTKVNILQSIFMIISKKKVNGKDALNFEGLIDNIEQCLQYWLGSDHQHTISGSLISPDHEFWRKSISTTYLNKANPTKLVNSIAWSSIRQEAKFFTYLIASILQGINNQISEYGRFSYAYNRIEQSENEDINNVAIDYFKTMAVGSYLRIYTLNYDRVIQYIFQKAELTAFQGFTPDTLVSQTSNEEQKVDSIRILTSFDENCIYHLHGNYAWHVKSSDFPGISDEIVNKSWGTDTSNRKFSLVNSELNKPFLNSNIITGFSKVQRTNSTPFKQMAYAFETDCTIADEIIIVGYSFGDIHINETIRQAKKVNPGCKIICVSPDEDTKDKILQNILFGGGQNLDNDFEKNQLQIHSEKYNCDIFTQSWKDYLERFRSPLRLS